MPDLSAKVDTRYLIQTKDESPAYITISTNGWRTGPRDVLEALTSADNSGLIDPDSYRFRIFISMETGDERYHFVNSMMWLGSGIRTKHEVIYDAYRIM
ncbi:MAG: hypothetical protein M1837_004048 [Sclerophora amabilis]|nr:MAG: hypothetical protein M1837_004048 [Sclerophora amabilis]